jgi:hypothetical protein
LTSAAALVDRLDSFEISDSLLLAQIFRKQCWIKPVRSILPESTTFASVGMLKADALSALHQRPVEDVFCTDALYRRLFESAGLKLLDVQSPLATDKEATRWISETRIAAWTIYVLDQ